MAPEVFDRGDLELPNKMVDRVHWLVPSRQESMSDDQAEDGVIDQLLSA